MYVNNTSDSDERADFLLYSDTFVLPNAKYDTLGYLRMNAYYASGLKLRILANKTYHQRKGVWDINETYNAGTTFYQQWVHIAIERYKEELSIYVGGKRIGVVPQYTFSFPGYTETIRSIIGIDTYNLSATGNYIDEIRMSKGAYYKGLDFNPPNAPF